MNYRSWLARVATVAAITVFGSALDLKHADADLFHKRTQTVQVVAAPVQAQYVAATPVYVASPRQHFHGQRLWLAVPSNPTSSQAAGASYLVGTPLATISQPSSLVTVSPGFPNYTITVGSAPTAAQPITESVSSSDAPYLTSIFDGSGRGPIAGLFKSALRQFIQTLGDKAKTFDYSAVIDLLINSFVGIDKSRAIPDIKNIINSLLNEGNSGASTQPLTGGSYQVNGTFSGTITIGSGKGQTNPGPAPGPAPTNNSASDPSDRDPNGAATAPSSF